jgi:prepilin peptidase CpaA
MDCLPTTVLASFLALAVAWDLRQRRIPNGLVIAYGMLGLALATGNGVGGVGRAAIGAVEGLALLGIPFALGFVGGGDAKFFAAVGAYLGPGLTPWAFLFGTALGAPIAALVWWRAPRTAGLQGVPYAVPLALGTVAALACDWAGVAVR